MKSSMTTEESIKQLELIVQEFNIPKDIVQHDYKIFFNSGLTHGYRELRTEFKDYINKLNNVIPEARRYAIINVRQLYESKRYLEQKSNSRL